MTGIWDVDKQIKRDTDLDPATLSGTVENSRKLYQWASVLSRVATRLCGHLF